MKFETTHINKDKKLRLLKARKIYLLIKPYFKKNINILEIGTGSGIFPSYASRLLKKAKIYSIDIVDQRIARAGYNFSLYSSKKIPFGNLKFDFVILNHVIEHVGSNNKQIRLLNEIYRVLRINGIVYFSVPNKYCLIEPHYNILFLSWLPRIIASFILRITKKNNEYEINLLTYFQCKKIFKKTNFFFKDITIDAMKLYFYLEKNRLLKKILIIPNIFFKILTYVFPTFIFILSKK